MNNRGRKSINKKNIMQNSITPKNFGQSRLKYKAPSDIKNMLMFPLNNGVLLRGFITRGLMNYVMLFIKIFPIELFTIVSSNNFHILAKPVSYTHLTLPTNREV